MSAPPLDGSQPPPPQQQQTSTTVVIQQPAATNVVFRDRPVTLPDGNVTILRYKTGTLTLLLVLLVCFFTLECGLCCLGLIPLCISAAKDVEHINPATGQVVGVYKRI